MRARTAILAPVILALLAGGCGSSTNDRQDVADKVSQFANALGKADYQTLCDKVFAPSLVSRTLALGLPCEVQLKRTIAPVKKPFAIVERVSVNGDHATAFVETGASGQPQAIATVLLVKTKAGWRVSGRENGAGGASTSSATGLTPPAKTITPPTATTTTPKTTPGD